MSEPRSPVLPDEVRERINAFLPPAHEVAFIDRLPLPKLVEDYCEKFVAIDRAGLPVAFIALSPASHPAAVREAATMSCGIQQRLGEPTGEAVLTPWFVGDLDGCSYSITAYCPAISRGRWSGRWQRLRLAGPILSWLADVSRASMQEVNDVQAAIRAPLMALAAHAPSDKETRQAATSALDELDRGRWHPRSVVAHNDLWWGNFVRRPSGTRAGPPFRVIDWAGASPQGMPFYDLVRVANSLRRGPMRFRRALREHCAILGCEPEQSRHYLCVAFGRLLGNLGEWPEEQFVGTARSCLRYVQEALDPPARSSSTARK